MMSVLESLLKQQSSGGIDRSGGSDDQDKPQKIQPEHSGRRSRQNPREQSGKQNIGQKIGVEIIIFPGAGTVDDSADISEQSCRKGK